MKKTLSFLLVVCCLLALCACGDTREQDTSNANKLTYGVKYISKASVSLPEEQQRYYMFEEDELLYHYFFEYEGHYDYILDQYTGAYVEHYTLTCKYEIMDDGTLVYFFDEVEIHDDDTKTVDKDVSDTAGILLFSKNVLTTPSGSIFINENYLDEELGNFGA